MTRVYLALAVVASMGVPSAGQVNMPNARDISGVPLATQDLPAGTISVRVVRGSIANGLPDQVVEFVIEGKTRAERTDGSGRARVNGLRFGMRVKASTTVEGERIESQDIVIGESGILVVLAATDPDAVKREEDDRRLATGPATKGLVVFGPETRIVGEFTWDDRLRIFYMLAIVNTARTPVDIGGPIALDLPTGARRAAILESSTPQATVSGARLIVTGPFRPGTTSVDVAFELPVRGGVAMLEQQWPVVLQATNVIVQQTGTVDIASPQLETINSGFAGTASVIAGRGKAIPAGHTLQLLIGGLPHHSVWPEFTAMTLAGAIVLAGLWAAFGPGARRQTRLMARRGRDQIPLAESAPRK